MRYTSTKTHWIVFNIQKVKMTHLVSITCKNVYWNKFIKWILANRRTIIQLTGWNKIFLHHMRYVTEFTLESALLKKLKICTSFWKAKDLIANKYKTTHVILKKYCNVQDGYFVDIQIHRHWLSIDINNVLSIILIDVDNYEQNCGSNKF